MPELSTPMPSLRTVVSLPGYLSVVGTCPESLLASASPGSRIFPHGDSSTMGPGQAPQAPQPAISLSDRYPGALTPQAAHPTFGALTRDTTRGRGIPGVRSLETRVAVERMPPQEAFR